VIAGIAMIFLLCGLTTAFAGMLMPLKYGNALFEGSGELWRSLRRYGVLVALLAAAMLAALAAIEWLLGLSA